MQLPLRTLLWLVWFFPCALGAASSPGHARTAQAMLGPGVWSRVIRVTNTAARSVYPPQTHALVFEFSGILWFYADVNGTQSLSLQTHRLAEDKADLGPLLRAIEPGFAAYTVLDGPADGAAGADRPPNDCFIASVAALQAQLVRGELIGEARLLSFYFNTREGRAGHTLLTYTTPRGAFVVDPARSARPEKVARGPAGDALAFARYLRPDFAPAKARWIPADAAVPALLAASGSPGRTPLGGETPLLR